MVYFVSNSQSSFQNLVLKKDYDEWRSKAKAQTEFSDDELTTWLETFSGGKVSKSDAKINDIDIISFCRGKMENYKIPRFIEYLTKLPKNEQGKILRNNL